MLTDTGVRRRVSFYMFSLFFFFVDFSMPTLLFCSLINTERYCRMPDIKENAIVAVMLCLINFIFIVRFTKFRTLFAQHFCCFLSFYVRFFIVLSNAHVRDWWCRWCIFVRSSVGGRYVYKIVSIIIVDAIVMRQNQPPTKLTCIEW